MNVTDLMSCSTIGITKLFKGHSLLLGAKSALHNEKPSVVAPRLTSSASALSSRLRAFLPELAAANEALAKRVLEEGPNAVDMNIKVSTSEDLDEEEDPDASSSAWTRPRSSRSQAFLLHLTLRGKTLCF